VRLRFVHRLWGDLYSEPFKGNLWHGLFGKCLHEADTRAFALLMGDRETQDGARPWALCAPLMLDEWLPADSRVEGVLTLIGQDAIRCRDACISALSAMGRHGFGRERVGATLEQLGLCTPGSSRPLADESLSLWDWWQASADEGAATDGISLELSSPLRLKVEGDILRDVPSLELLMRRLLGRLVQLADPDAGLFAPGEHRALIELARQSPVVAHHLTGVRWNRHSSRTRQNMPFEGLLGRILYGAPAGVLLPWLRLAEVLQLGGKVTFGMGVLRAEILQPSAFCGTLARLDPGDPCVG
jgi:hypothetical protein